MAIPFVTIELDKPYKVRFGMGAQLQYEQLSGKTIPELGQEMITGLSAKSQNQVLYAMLEKEIKDLTMEKLSELIDENVPNLDYLMDKIVEAVNAAYTVDLPNGEPPENG